MSERLPLELPSHRFLSQLARDDPGAYEALRRELIESLIDSAPEEIKPRLRGLQFRIDGVRQLSRSALGSTLKVYSLMWESFVRLNQEMSEFCDSPQTTRCLAAETAKIIEFRPRPPRGQH